MAYVYIDFEYNCTNEKDYNLVCCAYKLGKEPTKTVWLTDPESKKFLREELRRLKEHRFVSFEAVAEARCFCALDLDPRKFEWVDLRTEWKMTHNHSHLYAYGKQLIKGKVVETRPPISKWKRTEDDIENSNKPPTNLAGALYKMLGVQVDTSHKEAMRNLLISRPALFSEDEKVAILKYCASDVEHLPELFRAILYANQQRLPKSHQVTFMTEALNRGNYSARTAVMERIGYPVNIDEIKTFSKNVPLIMRKIQEDINSQFLDSPPFVLKKDTYSMNTKAVRAWIKKHCEENRIRNWIKTDTGLDSISVGAFEKHFHFRHDYPQGNFGAQMLRWFRFKQSLNGFMPEKESKGSFFDYVDSRGRVHPHMGIYGAQSARSQPKAKGFIPLKSAWMRSFIQPKPGNVIIGVDYSSQEFLLSGLVSNDLAMIEAYKSGDPYLYFGKSVGAIPKDGTKDTHKELRDKFKSTVLGLSYNMAKVSLAEKITQDTGIQTSIEDADSLIQQFYSAFPKFKEWNDLHLDQYQVNGFVKMPCGWYMWGDNDNFRSVNNVKIQGFGASIMRLAVANAQDSNLKVIFTLHDALYVECKDSELYEVTDILLRSMKDAFTFFFSKELVPFASLIRLESEAWGPTLTRGVVTTPNKNKIFCEPLHIDPRSKRDYDFFCPYFSGNQTKQNKE